MSSLSEPRVRAALAGPEQVSPAQGIQGSQPSQVGLDDAADLF